MYFFRNVLLCIVGLGTDLNISLLLLFFLFLFLLGRSLQKSLRLVAAIKSNQINQSIYITQRHNVSNALSSVALILSE